MPYKTVCVLWMLPHTTVFVGKASQKAYRRCRGPPLGMCEMCTAFELPVLNVSAQLWPCLSTGPSDLPPDLGPACGQGSGLGAVRD